MPRATKNPIVILALSPAATATALGIRPDQVAKAIADKLLRVRRIGVRTRILTSDIEKWVLSWPEPTKRGPYKKRKSPNA